MHRDSVLLLLSWKHMSLVSHCVTVTVTVQSWLRWSQSMERRGLQLRIILILSLCLSVFQFIDSLFDLWNAIVKNRHHNSPECIQFTIVWKKRKAENHYIWDGATSKYLAFSLTQSSLGMALLVGLECHGIWYTHACPSQDELWWATVFSFSVKFQIVL